MKYNSAKLLEIIMKFEDLSDAINEYLNIKLDKDLFYESLADSLKLSKGLMTEVEKYINDSKRIKFNYLKNIEENIDNNIKKQFLKNEKREKDFFEKHYIEKNISKNEFLFICYLMKLIDFKESYIYYFELTSPFGYQGYPILNAVSKIIKDFSGKVNYEYSLNKIYNLYRQKEFTNSPLKTFTIDEILRNKEKYKKGS